MSALRAIDRRLFTRKPGRIRSVLLAVLIGALLGACLVSFVTPGG